MVAKNKRISSRESSTPGGEFRWGVEQRLKFVEDRLFWLSEINRQDLIERFGISMSQASADINRYLKQAPEGVRYDKSAKRYVAGEDFKPVLDAPDAERLLAELRLVDAGLLTPEGTQLGLVLPLDTAPAPERPVDPYVLRIVWHAICRAQRMSMLYQSMSRTEPLERKIEPHALAHDGFRWHVRAWDGVSGEFQDFVLGRMTNARLTGAAVHGGDADSDWNAWVELQIAPHPDLSPSQRSAISLDYGIEKDHAVLRVRRALLFYALRRLGLDTPPGSRSPQEQHIVLNNREEILKLLDQG